MLSSLNNYHQTDVATKGFWEIHALKIKAVLFSFLQYYNFNGKMPHITYDYTVPRTPPLRTAAPALARPLYHHLPVTSQSHPIPANSRAAQADFNATWLSPSPDDTSEQLPLRERQEDLDFGPPHFFQTNSTSQTQDWGWEQSEEKEKYDFQIRQVYHANTAGEEEEEEATVGGETELGRLLCFSLPCCIEWKQTFSSGLLEI